MADKGKRVKYHATIEWRSRTYRYGEGTRYLGGPHVQIHQGSAGSVGVPLKEFFGAVDPEPLAANCYWGPSGLGEPSIEVAPTEPPPAPKPEAVLVPKKKSKAKPVSKDN